MSAHHQDARSEQSVMPPVLVINAEGRSPFVLACDHASNRIPDEYDGLGLTRAPAADAHRLGPRRVRGGGAAGGGARRAAGGLDGEPAGGRLQPRPRRGGPDARLLRTDRDPGNAGVGNNERADRIARYHTPFHAALTEALDRRKAQGMPAILVTVHSFTPVYKDVPRPWPIGLIHARDDRFTAALRDALAADDASLDIGWNQPYFGPQRRHLHARAPWRRSQHRSDDARNPARRDSRGRRGRPVGRPAGLLLHRRARCARQQAA